MGHLIILAAWQASDSDAEPSELHLRVRRARATSPLAERNATACLSRLCLPLPGSLRIQPADIFRNLTLHLQASLKMTLKFTHHVRLTGGWC
jgi:hypothetical protein